jgi:hypothetical protein
MLSFAAVRSSQPVYDNGAERELRVTMHVSDDVSGVSWAAESSWLHRTAR